MGSGIEIAIAKAVGPLVVQLAKGAVGKAKDGLKRWSDLRFEDRLAEKLAITDRIKTLWSPEKETSLLEIYFPSTVMVGPANPKRIDSLKELPEGNVVIEGIVGHGKSIFLRYLCLQELSGVGSGTLPLFLELRVLTAKKGLQERLYEAMDKLDVDNSPEVFDHLARSGKVSLLLDGFDELDENLVPETIQHLEFLMEKYPTLRIIITSRPSNEIQKSRHVRKVSLCGLKKKDYQSFLRKLGLAQDKILDIIDAINRSPRDISSLITTPLMLTLLVLVYESEREIPAELPEFYERLFSTMFSRHDRLKAGFNRKHHSGLSEQKLQKLFEVFCFLALRNKHGRTLTSAEFHENFERAKEVAQETLTLEEKFKIDIVKIACLMLEEGFDSITFLHMSIAEYFAASFIKRSSEDLAKKFYTKAIRASDNWEATLSFLEKIDSYRYEKYFNLPRYLALLEEIKGDINRNADPSAWLNLFLTANPDFRLGFGRIDDSPSDIEPRGYGPYVSSQKWSEQINGQIIQILIDSLITAVPSVTSIETAMDEPNHYFRDQTGEYEFVMPLRIALKTFDFNKLYVKLAAYEISMWRIIERSREIIEAEEKKSSLFNDEFF